MIRAGVQTMLLVIGFVMFALPAFAQSCTASISNLNFGTVNLLSGSAYDSTATLSISCTNTQNLSLAARACLNLGNGAGGASGSTRTMASGTQLLNYQLYQDANRSLPWGSTSLPALGTAWSHDFLMLPLTTYTTSRTIYGRILANQQTTLGGSYISAFSGTHATLNWSAYDLVAPACSTMTQNPIYPNFTVQTLVDRTCSVTSENMNFGSRGLLKTQVDATARLFVSCTSGLPFTVSLNGGLANAVPTQRKMSYNGQSITYGLYSDTARQVPWGNAAGTILSAVGNGLSQTLTVYGRVPSQTTPSPGIYTDTVVVTVTF